MNFPKLKYAKLCRILPYCIVIGAASLPTVLVFCVPAPDVLRIIVLFASLIGLLYYILKNFMVLMGMDILLASLSCYQTARTQYFLPAARTPERIRSSILHYGQACTPIPYQPQPAALRYKFSSPLTYHNQGVERIIAAYEVDCLNADTYGSIIRSAKANSTALAGKRKAIFLDKAQKKAPLHRVTVVLILAHSVDPAIADGLYDRVCRQCGDEEENCVIPCVVDLSRGTCVFNSLRLPYVGFSYAVKNRGIRIIKHRIFGGNLQLRNSTAFLPPIPDLNPEDTLWDLWRFLHRQVIGSARADRRRFRAMAEKEIQAEDRALYLKWDQRGICQRIELDPDAKTVQVESVTHWYYPKQQPIGKQTIQKICDHIASYWEEAGYSASFIRFDDTE